MQIRYTCEVSGWLADKYTFSKRWYNKIHKEELKESGVWWHGKFLKYHFTRQAYHRYGPDYHMKRKRVGKPLVVKGHLRRRMLQGPVKVTGTSRQATVHLPYGNPKNKTGRELHIETLIIMRKEGLDYKTARRKVTRANAYDTWVKAMFQSAIASVHPKEEQQMAERLARREEKLVMAEAARKRGLRKKLK